MIENLLPDRSEFHVPRHKITRGYLIFKVEACTATDRLIGLAVGFLQLANSVSQRLPSPLKPNSH